MRAFQGCAVVVTAVVVAVLLVTTLPTGAQAGIGSILSNIFETTFQEREIYLLDHYCTVRRQPYIKRWEVYYKAWVNCPGWTTIQGRGSNHRNANSAEHAATRDFMNQAISRGLVTKEEAAPWLA